MRAVRKKEGPATNKPNLTRCNSELRRNTTASCATLNKIIRKCSYLHNSRMPEIIKVKYKLHEQAVSASFRNSFIVREGMNALVWKEGDTEGERE